MKLLLLPSYFYPESYASAHMDSDLYEHLIFSGFRLLIYAPLPTRGVEEVIRNQFYQRKHELKVNGNFEIYRFYLLREKNNTIQRATRYFLLIIIQFFKGIFARNVKLIFLMSTPPIIGLVGGLLKKIKKIPFIYVVQDIFPDSLVHTGIATHGSIVWKIGRLIENFTYRNATKIIVISQDFKANLLAKNVPESKIEVIYNWTDTKKIMPIPRERNILFSQWNLNSAMFYIVYAGNFGNSQSVDTIIECAKLLAEKPIIQFVLVGTGSQEKSLKQLVSYYQLQNVQFFPIQSSEMLSEVYSLGDIGVVCCKKGLGKSAFPSKTWSYFAAGTPIIASYDIDSELSNMIIKNELGISVNPENAKEMSRAIIALEKNKKMLKSMAENVRIFVETNASKEKSTEKYVCVIKEALSSLK